METEMFSISFTKKKKKMGQKRENNLFTLITKMKILLACSHHHYTQQLVVDLCFYRVKEAQLLPNQLTHIFLELFSKYKY